MDICSLVLDIIIILECGGWYVETRCWLVEMAGFALFVWVNTNSNKLIGVHQSWLINHLSRHNKHQLYSYIQPSFTNTITNSIVRNLLSSGWSTCSDVFNDVRNPKHQLVFDWRHLSMRDQYIGFILYYIVYKGY